MCRSRLISPVVIMAVGAAQTRVISLLLYLLLFFPPPTDCVSGGSGRLSLLCTAQGRGCESVIVRWLLSVTDWRLSQSVSRFFYSITGLMEKDFYSKCGISRVTECSLFQTLTLLKFEK